MSISTKGPNIQQPNLKTMKHDLIIYKIMHQNIILGYNLTKSYKSR